MSFIIEINGKDITTIEEIRENFDIDVLLSHRDNFDVWLAGWDYEDEAAQVRELPPELSDDDWLKKVCKIIGIPSATLTAAKRKRTSDAKKAEKAKAAEEEKKKESEAKKKVAKKKAGEIDFNKLRINIEKYPDLGLPSFVCDKGAIFRSDDNLVFIDANADIHTTKDSPLKGKSIDCIEQINGFFIILHTCGEGISFSEDGIHWQTRDAENFRKYELEECFEDVQLHGIVFDGKQYVILCSQNYRYEEAGWFSEEKWRRDYHIAKADSLSDKWECQDAYCINGHNCYNFFFQNNKFFVEITDYDDNGDWTEQAVYYSDDAINWTEADSSDRGWLEDLTLTNDRISFSIFWWDQRWAFGISKIILNDLVYKNKIIFKFEANKVLAALVLDKDKEEYSEFKVVAECDFTLDSVFLCNDKLFLCNEKFSLFDSNPEKHLAIGKITFD